jgi:xanthine dehydrogenase YagR molybdenum-binding subunit
VKRVEKNWPTLDRAIHLGKRTTRVDGPDKVTGRAKYTFDVQPKGMVHAKFAIAKVAHGKVRGVDLAKAKAVAGCLDARALVRAGDEVMFHGWPVAVVAAETEEAAREAAHAVVVDFEVLPHNHQARELEKIAPEWLRDGRERVEGDPDAGFDRAHVVHEGFYGCEMITHCCLESHGVVVAHDGEDALTVWCSTQNVSGMAEQAAAVSDVEQGKIHVICQHLGGGFGSKFQFDCGPEAIAISRDLGRPVKLMLERDMELMYAGSRPNHFARVKVGVAQDGKVTAFESQSWGSNGPDGRSRLALPYVFQFKDRRENHGNVRSHTGPDRAWRAPNHPQQCLITMAALEDAAARLGMDPLEFFRRNLDVTRARETYE